MYVDSAEMRCFTHTLGGAGKLGQERGQGCTTSLLLSACEPLPMLPTRVEREGKLVELSSLSP